MYNCINQLWKKKNIKIFSKYVVRTQSEEFFNFPDRKKPYWVPTQNNLLLEILIVVDVEN